MRPLLSLPLLLASLHLAAPALALDRAERRVARAVDSDAAIALLASLVDQSSGTLDVAGVEAVHDALAPRLEALGFATRRAPAPEGAPRAGHLIASRPGDGRGARILLMAHADTVFEASDPAGPGGFSRDGDVARGPGVVDDKGGIAVILGALEALDAAGALEGLHVTVLVTGDEEKVARPVDQARAIVGELAASHDLALSFEGAGALGEAVIARRGWTGWTLEVQGTRGHSSQVVRSDYGYGACNELARIQQRFLRILESEDHLTINAGLAACGSDVSVDGEQVGLTAGGKANVIAERGWARGDLRALDLAQRERVVDAMQTAVAESLPGTSASLTFDHVYPPMGPGEGNRALLAALDAVNRDLKLGPVEAVGVTERGASDANFLAGAIPALDGLGAVGGGAHSRDEWVELDALEPVIQRTAILILRLGSEAWG